MNRSEKSFFDFIYGNIARKNMKIVIIPAMMPIKAAKESMSIPLKKVVV
jgi:hypothetical protein